MRDMRKMNFAWRRVALAGLALVLNGAAISASAHAAEQAPDVKPQLQITSAERLSAASGVKILAATRAGKRIVAVGDYGVVLLSDDDGKTYRQARSVPISATLTAVSFADAGTGWAVGHWGAILNTRDGGETWSLQRSDMHVDQPLFSVYFRNADEGWAVGLWSLMLHTTDGGASWSGVPLPVAPGAKKADRNLYSIFGDAKGSLFITSEQGLVLRATDGGKTWTYAQTGYGGSFWSGVALNDGALLVGGLRGTIYRSADGGDSWQTSKTDFKSSVTNIVQRADKTVVAVGLDGMTLVSIDGGLSFSGTQRPDRSPLTAVVDSQSDGPKFFSTKGPISK